MQRYSWTLEIHGPKLGVGTYTDNPLVRITHIHANHRIIKLGVGAYTEMALTQRVWISSDVHGCLFGLF